MWNYTKCKILSEIPITPSQISVFYKNTLISITKHMSLIGSKFTWVLLLSYCKINIQQRVPRWKWYSKECGSKNSSGTDTMNGKYRVLVALNGLVMWMTNCSSVCLVTTNNSQVETNCVSMLRPHSYICEFNHSSFDCGPNECTMHDNAQIIRWSINIITHFIPGCYQVLILIIFWPSGGIHCSREGTLSSSSLFKAE